MAGASSVIDALVVEVGLDPAKFNQGQKDAVEAHKRVVDEMTTGGRKIEEQGLKISDAFDKLKREAFAITAVFLGGRGVKEFVSDVTHLDAATGRMALVTAMATREMSAWQGAVKQNGGSAESATGAIAGLSGEMSRFMLTGQTGMLPVLNRLGISLFGVNKEIKTADQLLLELAERTQGMDPRTANSFLGMIPGMNQDMINLLIQGRRAVEGYLDEARRAGGTTAESAAAAREYQKELALLDLAATSAGRTLLTVFAPAVTTALNGVTNLINKIREGSLGSQKYSDSKGLMSDLARWITGDNVDAIARSYGYYDESPGPSRRPRRAVAPIGDQKSESAPSLSEREAYIRAAAAKRGIDPDVAVKVWESEGKHGVGPNKQSTVIQKNGQREESFGPFQLFMGGGLGNKFQKDTGLDPRDGSTWKQQVDFSLDEARKGGWGPWHGWKGLPFAGIGRPGSGAAASASAGSSESGRSTTNTTNVTIGSINLPNVSDAQGFAREIKPAMKNLSFGAPANNGLN